MSAPDLTWAGPICRHCGKPITNAGVTNPGNPHVWVHARIEDITGEHIAAPDSREARTYELVPGDVVIGHGRIVSVEDAGWAGWRYVHFADGTRSHSVSLNQIWDLTP